MVKRSQLVVQVNPFYLLSTCRFDSVWMPMDPHWRASVDITGMTGRYFLLSGGFSDGIHPQIPLLLSFSEKFWILMDIEVRLKGAFILIV